MRILHLDPDDMANPYSGGGPIRTHEIYKRLARRHDITVLTPTFEGSTPELYRNNIRYLRLGKKIRDHGSSHHITYLLSLPKAVRQFDYDLLVEDFMPPASATWTPIFRRRDRPLIASVQWFFFFFYTKRLKLPFHWGEEFGVKMYDNFVVMTAAMRERITARHANANCQVIGNGVDDSLFDIQQKPGHGVLFLGRIEIHAKGIDLLLDAFSRIPEIERQPLILAGTVQEPELLEGLINRYSLQQWVRIVGPYDSETRIRLLAECRFVVIPSRTETFGMTIAEANAAGRQVIIWDCAPMNEVAAPGCPRVKPFDISAYSLAMRELLALPPEQLSFLGEKARSFARRWDWDTAAQLQEQFYLDVIENHRSKTERIRNAET